MVLLGQTDSRGTAPVVRLLAVPDPVARDIVHPVDTGAVGPEDGHRGVGVLLYPLQSLPQQGYKCLWGHLGTNVEVLEDELICLLEPDVNCPHGFVGKGSYPHLFPLTVVDINHPHALLLPRQYPGHPDVHVRTLVCELGWKHLSCLDINPHPVQYRIRGPVPPDSAQLAHTTGDKLQSWSLLVKSSQSFTDKTRPNTLGITEGSE